jgi:hypothetical protein
MSSSTPPQYKNLDFDSDRSSMITSIFKQPKKKISMKIVLGIVFVTSCVLLFMYLHSWSRSDKKKNEISSNVTNELATPHTEQHSSSGNNNANGSLLRDEHMHHDKVSDESTMTFTLHPPNAY